MASEGSFCLVRNAAASSSPAAPQTADCPSSEQVNVLAPKEAEQTPAEQLPQPLPELNSPVARASRASA